MADFKPEGLDPRSWPRVDLVDRLEAALQFQEAARPLLAVHDSEVAGGQDFLLDRHKFVCETALLLLAADRTGVDRLGPRIHNLAAQLESAARSDEVLTWARLRPAVAMELAVAHYCLSEIGLKDQEFDEEISAAIDSSTIGPPERSPWKDLEADWHVGLRTGATHPGPESTLLRSAIANTPDALFGSRLDSYCFTHAMMYATDFGHSRPPFPLSSQDMVATAQAALSGCLDDDDFDLVAEILMTWPQLRAEWTALPTFAFRVMMNISDSAGILPSLGFRSEVYRELEPSAANRYFYKQGYHAECVKGFLLAVALLPDAAPPLQLNVNPNPDAHRTFTALCELLPPRDPIPHWQLVMADCSETEQASLVGLLADITVRRAAQGADYDLLQQALAISLNSGIAPSPVVIQGVELLGRMSRVAAKTPGT